MITEGQVECYEEAMAVVVGKARQPVGDDGFWSDYVRLERVYNAVEVCFASLFIGMIWLKCCCFYRFWASVPLLYP